MRDQVNARRSDPATSHAAARTIRPGHAQRLLTEFAACPQGLTSEQAALRANLFHVGYWKRVSDLLRDGKIKPLYKDGKAVTEVASTGRRVTVWVAV